MFFTDVAKIEKFKPDSLTLDKLTALTLQLSDQRTTSLQEAQLLVDAKTKLQETNKTETLELEAKVGLASDNKTYELLTKAKALILVAIGSATTTALENNQINQPNAIITALLQRIRDLPEVTDGKREAIDFVRAYIPPPQLFLLSKKSLEPASKVKLMG